MQGRLVPILQKTKDGKVMMMGYRRKGNSRKSNQVIEFREPQEVPELSKKLQTPTTTLPDTIQIPEAITL